MREGAHDENIPRNRHVSILMECHYLHIRGVARRFVFQHPQQSTHPLYGLFRHFFTDIYSLLKTRVAVYCVSSDYLMNARPRLTLYNILH